MKKSKYDMFDERVKEVTIKSKLDAGEMILWQGGPLLKAYKFSEPSFAIFALIWATFDMLFLTTIFGNGLAQFNIFLFFGLLAFFGVHLMPVWVFLSRLRKEKKEWETTEYAITDSNIIVKSGFKNKVVTKYSYKDIESISLRREKQDKKYGTGDILIEMKDEEYVDILDIIDYDKVFKLIQRQTYGENVDVSYIEEEVAK